MYEEALQAAEHYIPSMIPEVHRSMAERLESVQDSLIHQSENRVAAIIDRAQIYEKACQFEKAAELLLSVRTVDANDHDLLQKAQQYTN